MATWPYRDLGGPIDALLSPRLSQPITFARLPFTRDLEGRGVKGAFLGVPFDGGTTYYGGARLAPTYIRLESRILRPYNPVLGVYPFRELKAVDYGDVDVVPTSVEKTLDRVEDVVRDLVRQGATPFIAGGDHSITLGVLRALAKFRPILVHLDSHLDYWDVYWGTERYTHGTWVRRAIEEGLVKSVVQVGIRGSLYDKSDMDYPRESPVPIEVVTMEEISARGLNGLLQKIASLSGNVYVSVDIDVVDPAYAPGTGTREVGGFSSREVLVVVRELVRARAELVGFDVVEVSPPLDVSNITSLLAANLIYEAMSIKAKLGQQSLGNA